MVSRYLHSKIDKIWNEQQIAQLYWKIEIYVAEAWHLQGLISIQDLKQIQKTKVSFSRWKELEKENHHEMAAFVDMLSEQAGSAGRFLHFGLTSNDVLDTAHHHLLFQTNEVLLDLLTQHLVTLKKLAHVEKKTLMIGRTHGMYAEPITLGYKFALWYSELKRHHFRLFQANQMINVCKIAGPTGLRPNVPLAINLYVADQLKMKMVLDTNQLIIRDRLVDLANVWIGLSLTIEKIATEIRNLQRDGINELQEAFFTDQKGSSAMPHKKNPYLSENICGLMRSLRCDSQTLWSTNLTWHERDLTNSAIERIKLVDISHLLATGLERMLHVFENLQVNHQQISKNLKRGFPAIISHQLLLLLIEKFQYSRVQAYRAIQKLFNGSTIDSNHIWAKMQKDPIFKKINQKQWTEIVNGKIYFSQLDQLFDFIFNE